MPADNESLYQELRHNLTLFPDRVARVFHGRGKYFDGLDDINIEWYPPYLFVQNFSDRLNDDVSHTLKRIFEENHAISAIVIQTRSWPELDTSLLCQRGVIELPIEHIGQLHEDLKCQVKLGENRNTGVFLDMRAGWNWVQDNSNGKSVLNLFSYTGIFSLHALKGGAKKVVNVDMSTGALKTAQRNHALNGYNSGEATFLKRDILKSGKKIAANGPFDLIITDPPPYQKKSFRGWQDYLKLLSWCKDCLSENGTLLICLNNPHVSQQELVEELKSSFAEAKSFTTIESSLEIKELNPQKGLKVVALEMK